MWKYKETFNGLSVLPFSDHTYVQAPFTDCTKEEFEEMVQHLHKVDLSQIVEFEDNTDLSESLACSGGNCEIT